jgi:O-antigen/teichoic acid export membrane protein
MMASSEPELPPASPNVGTISPDLIRGGGYLAARYGLGVLVSIGNMFVLTWWIGPHAYGVFITAIGVVAFLANMARAGIDTYLVRQVEIPSANLYNAANAMILFISSALMIAGASAIYFLIPWYGSREFVFPYLVLLLSVPMIGLTGVPMAKLERELDFRAVAEIEFSGQSLGLAVGTLMAALHFGVWAPVSGQLAWQIFTFYTAWRRSHLHLSLRFHGAPVKEMLRYGLGCTASLRAWQVRTLVNPLLVGHFVGVEGVAFVALALRIAEALGTFRLAAGRMAIAALARMQDDLEQFRQLLQRAMYLQVVTLGPLLCLFASLGPPIFRHVVGVRWLPSLTIYPFIAAGVLVNSVYNLQASALFVLGRQMIVMIGYLLHVSVLAAAAFFLVPRMGVVGYGWAELAACSAYLVIHRGTARQFAINYRSLAPLTAGFLVLLFA